MLLIRQDQMQVFKETALKNYENELVKDLAEFAPELFKIRGEECFRQTVQLGMQRADGYGFTNRGPIRFYVQTMFSLGCDFDTDPQLAWASEVLAKQEVIPNQMERGDLLYKKLCEYMNKAMGPENSYSVAALKRLSTADDSLLQLSDTTPSILTLFKSYYPEKFGYVGEEQLIELIEKSTKEEEEYKLTSPKGRILINILKFALGHGISTDPLYPWVHETLTSSQLKNEEERITRLFKRTKTYLKATLQHLAPTENT